MDPKKRVEWVQKELLIRKLPKSKGLAIFKETFGTDGLNLKSDSYINENFTELHQFIDKRKSMIGKKRSVKIPTPEEVVKRVFTRTTKNEAKVIKDIVKNNQDGLLIDSFVNWLTVVGKKK